MSKNVSDLRAELAQTTDPAKYDELVKAIGKAEKAQSITTATNKKAEAEKAEAHRQEQTKKLESLLAEGQELKGSFLNGKSEMLAGLNKFFLALEQEWKTYHQLKAIQTRVATISTELNGEPVKFTINGDFWHVSLSGDIREIAKTIMSIFAVEWSNSNHFRGQPTDNPLKLVDVKRMNESRGP